VRFGDQVYELLAVAVTGREEISAILPAYYAKDGDGSARDCQPPNASPDCRLPDVAFVRLEPRQ